MYFVDLIRSSDSSFGTTLHTPSLQALSSILPCGMQRLIARTSSRGGFRASKASTQSLAASWRSFSIVDSSSTRRVCGGGSTTANRRSVYTWSVPIPLTKIVATIGPVSEQFEPLQKVWMVHGCNRFHDYARAVNLIPIGRIFVLAVVQRSQRLISFTEVHHMRAVVAVYIDTARAPRPHGKRLQRMGRSHRCVAWDVRPISPGMSETFHMYR